MFDARRAFSLALAFALLFGAATDVAAKAAEPDHAAAAAGDHGSHGKPKGGLDFLQLERYDLGIFTLIVFGSLVLILTKTAFPKISAGLAKREATIKGFRDEAALAKTEAEALRAQLLKDHATAQDQIRALLEEARRDADVLRAEQREAGIRDAAAERDRAKREIQAATDVALNDLYKQAVDLAALMSAKTLSRQISSEDHKKLLDESLAELKQAADKA